MTREKALKKVIRARAAKTGERYTTARRHVLSALASSRAAAPPASRTPPAPTRGSVSDAKFIEKTGYGLDHWFAVLDRFGAVAKGHSAAARHLHVDHQVSGWYSQSITVAYERARGVRAINQRCDGDYEVSVSKVMAAGTATVIKAFTDTRMRRRWMDGIDPSLATALAAAITDKASKGFVVRADGLARFRYKWDHTTVQFYLDPKPGDKVSVVVQHTKLPDASSVETHRGHWRAVLGTVAALVASRR